MIQALTFIVVGNHCAMLPSRVEKWALETDRQEFEFLLCLSLTIWPWTSYIMTMVMIPALEAFYEDQIKQQQQQMYTLQKLLALTGTRSSPKI